MLSLCVLFALAVSCVCQGLIIFRLFRRSDDGLTDGQLLQVARLVSRLAPSGQSAPPVSVSETNVVPAALSCPWPSGVSVCGVNGYLIAYDIEAPTSFRCKVGDVSFWDGAKVLRILPRIIETELGRYERDFGKELKGETNDNK